MTRNRTRPSRPAGFTLTEVMIALAMTALLLVGISKIFALTSATISTGQAAAKAMRSQRAIQQTLSNDFLGNGPDIGSATYEAGMLPLVNTADADYAAPYLTISNFRIPTYLNANEMSADTVGPIDQSTNIMPAQYAARSLAIRGTDLNKNGIEDQTSIMAVGGQGETIPLYFYGDRNFRCDTLSFFVRGRFASQTGSNGRYQDKVSSNEAMVWYGHLRTFNSDATQLNRAAGHGNPGEWLTSNNSPNRNNRFADQFRLGRVASLLIEPTDQDGIPGTTSADNLFQYNTVTNGGDPTQPSFFLRRNWWSPTFKATTGSPPARPTLTPNLTSVVYVYDSTNQNQNVRLDDKTAAGGSTSTVSLTGATCRTDVFGIGVKPFRSRTRFVEQNDVDAPPANTQDYWWTFVPTSWSDRYYANPFPALGATGTLKSQGASQRQQLLADACSQFIVEYAGDFVTQDAGTGVVTATLPDGVLDFAEVNTMRQTRWYGMPRDVDGDGHIRTSVPAMASSPDVVPLADFAGTRQSLLPKPVARNPGESDADYMNRLGPSIGYSFERVLPPLAMSNDYALNVAEPTTGASPDTTSYVCMWGAFEFEHGTTLANPDGTTRTVYAVPQLIRVLTDVRDPDGKMKEPMTQEYVFPVRVTGAVKAPTTAN